MPDFSIEGVKRWQREPSARLAAFALLLGQRGPSFLVSEDERLGGLVVSLKRAVLIVSHSVDH